MQQFITSRKCAYYLWVLGIIWLVIGIIPAMIGAVVFPLDAVEGLPTDTVFELPTSGRGFWIHRVAVDPLTKSIGAVPAVILLVVLLIREISK